MIFMVNLANTQARWIDILMASSGPIALVIALVTWWLQNRLLKRQLQHDLFEKRFEVYDAVGILVHKIMSADVLENRDLEIFTKHVRTAPFLFEPPVATFMDEVCTKALRLIETHEHGLPVSDPDDNANIRKWFRTTPVSRAKDLFSPYLRLR